MYAVYVVVAQPLHFAFSIGITFQFEYPSISISRAIVSLSIGITFQFQYLSTSISRAIVGSLNCFAKLFPWACQVLRMSLDVKSHVEFQMLRVILGSYVEGFEKAHIPMYLVTLVTGMSLMSVVFPL